MKSSAATSKQVKRPTVLLCLGVAAATLAGCSTLHPVSVAGLRSAVGNTIPGTKGETLEDQDRIDEHVARACAAQVYTAEECTAHTVASDERRLELLEQLADTNAAGV